MDTKKYVAQFKKNDYSQFDEFYSQTKKQVYFTCLSVLKDSALAEDVMQETYISFLENIDTYKGNSNIFAYLTVVARNKCINIYNKNKKIDYNDEKLTNIPLEQDFDSSGVEEILKLLKNPVDREIITYHIILEYKFKEIAKITDMPLGTVLWRYNKAIKTLKQEVSENE